MSDRRGAAEAMSASPKWLGCLLKWLGMLLLAALCALIGYAYGQFRTYKEAERDYAEVLVAAFYDPDTRNLFFDGGYSKDVHEESGKVLKEQGEAESYTITRVDPGPAKTFIFVRVVRDGKQFDEYVAFLAREIYDFRAQPVDASDNSQNQQGQADPYPSQD
jgi:hypothetical protein